MKRKGITFSKIFFFSLIFLLPLNLAKHFEIPDSFVWGILVDYLVPALYVQDILILGITLSWLLEKGLPTKNTLIKLFSDKDFFLFIFFIFTLALSTLSAVRIIPSFYIFLHTFLYFLLFIYIAFEVDLEKDFPVILRLLASGILFTGILGIGQYVKQASVFNNYLFLGEQPYSYSTWGIQKENIFGVWKIPAYSLFRHPNIFGGYLSVLLIWIFSFIKKSGSKESSFYKIVFLLGSVSLFLTFSWVAWGAFILGLLSYFFINIKFSENLLFKKKIVLYVFLLTSLCAFILPLWFANSKEPSFFRRESLFTASLKVSKINPLFGVGSGNIVVYIDQFSSKFSRDLRFTQPVHNIFLLVLAENGVFALILFLTILYKAFRKLLNYSYFSLFLISLLQVVFIGSLDHYFLTIHQTNLLSWVLLGLIFKKQS